MSDPPPPPQPPGEPLAPRSPIAILKARGLHAKKRFGQNFLLDREVCRRIAEAARAEPANKATPEAATGPAAGDDAASVLEIGPGLGSLTRHLCDAFGRVVAIERDRDMVDALREEPAFADAIARGRLEVIEADALEADWTALLGSGPSRRAIVGNLPYLLTGRFLERAIHESPRISRAVFMVQLEVAERLVAKPSTKDYGALTVFTRACFDVARLLTVRAGAFHPRPDVDSAVVVLTPRADPDVESDTFRSLVRGAFGMRRKTLRNAWKSVSDPAAVAAAAAAAGVDLDRRGETLAVAEFAAVARALDAGPGQSDRG